MSTIQSAFVRFFTEAATRIDLRNDRLTCKPSSGITPREDGAHHPSGPPRDRRIGNRPRR